MKIRVTYTLLLLTLSLAARATGIAVLDVAAVNGEHEESGDFARQLYSTQYLCQLTGYPYFVTTDAREATEGDMIIITSRIKDNTLTADERQLLSDYVERGGVLVATVVTAKTPATTEWARQLWGITQMPTVAKSRRHIMWSEERRAESELTYIDEPAERDMEIGEIHTAGYTAADGTDVLATFDDGSAAVLRHAAGRGRAYLLGVYLRDIIARSQLAKLPVSTKDTSEKFLPTADVLPLFIRATYAATHDVSVWKFTVPDGAECVLLPTHDCDSRSAYDNMHYMSELERRLGIRGQYMLTCHYYRDADFFPHTYLSAFYNDETIAAARRLLRDGHTVGSHSICHFPDFNKYSGAKANMDVVTREEYMRRATCDESTRSSQGASTWAEIVLSKQIIEGDLGNHVRSFRSGHLLVNDDFATAHELGSYEFSSCYNASALHSEFPTRMRVGNAWEGREGKFLVMPINISDVLKYEDEGGAITDDDWETHPIVDHWVENLRALRGNYAPCVLLIHPNREWKATIEERLISRLDTAHYAAGNFERYGDFWLAREKATVSHVWDESSHTIAITTDADPAAGLGYAVETRHGVEKAVIRYKDGGTSGATVREIAPDRWLVTPQATGADLPSSLLTPHSATQTRTPAAYYNVQGQRLSAPGRGLCLRVENGRTEKVITRK